MTDAATGMGTTMLCTHCRRPIINAAAVYGKAGEPYHFECTRSPQADTGQVFVNQTPYGFEALLQSLVRIEALLKRIDEKP